MCTAHDLFEKSQLNQDVVRKFDHAVMIRCRSILEKGAISVLANLFGLQNFRSHLEANNSTFPIELVLLNIAKAIRLVIEWSCERRRLDLFSSRGIIERAVYDFVVRLREHRHLGVADVLSLPLRIEDEPILRQFFRVDLLLRNFEPNVQPSLSVALLRPHFLKRR